LIERIEEEDGYGDLQARVESERSIDELDQSEGSYSSQSSQSDSNNSVISKYNSSSSSDTSSSTSTEKSDEEASNVKLKETDQNFRKVSHRKPVWPKLNDNTGIDKNTELIPIFHWNYH